MYWLDTFQNHLFTQSTKIQINWNIIFRMISNITGMVYQTIVPKETEVVSSCIRYLNANGMFSWRSNNMGVARQEGGRKFHTFNGIRGVSDIIGVLPDGRILCVECKRPGKLNNQSDDQKYFQEQVEKNHGVYVLCDSWVMLEEKLKAIGVVK